jgi:amino acid adenylation domain-containing protein
VIPRWTLDPLPGVAEHAVPLPATPSEAALRAAHARVLTALTGEETTADDVIGVTISDGGALLLRYRTDVLDADAAARIAGYHVAALAGEPLLSADELSFQLEGLAGPRRELPDRRFHELFEQRVAEHPDAVAAIQGDREWTYRELNARANRLGRALLARGLRAEGVVAVVTERNLDWMAAVIAIFKAGGAYLPIEPHFPPDRIATMLARADCRLVLDATLIDRAYAEDHDDSDLGVRVPADALAYIYFTSGSTGAPKGAMCEHAGMLNHLFAKIDDLEIGAGQVVAQTAPQCFDISLWQLVSALLVGARTLIVEQDAILDVERFADTIAAGNVGVLQVVPSYLEAVLAYLDEHPRELPDLRCVSVTGEALKKELAERWFAAKPRIKLVNAYGLTETSDDTNHEVMDRPPEGERVPLGPAVNNVRVYVVDEQLQPVPLGAPGEIVFSGVCVGRGYVNDPERTAAAFMDDPHRPGERLYRSGDFGRWRPDGKLEFLGRRDAQVKLRGFRIEIGEVENALVRVPGVRSGAVVVADERLVAFYAADRPLGAEALRDRLGESLPEYMVPSAFHWRERLPLTDNGKTDRKALAGELEAAEERSGAPATPAERRLAAAWAKALGIRSEQIGRQDHFFDRGGTSLAAVKLVVALDRALSLSDVTRFPVLADQAGLLDGVPELREAV